MSELEGHEPDQEAAKEPLDDYIARHMQEQRAESAGINDFRERVAEEVVPGQAVAVARAVELVRDNGWPGMHEDVFSAAEGDVVGGRVLDSVYERLGLTEARQEAQGKEIIGDEGELLGHDYVVVDQEDSRINERVIDTREVGSIRTLQVTRLKRA